MIRIAVIGFGYWGPNLVRNFARLPQVSVSWVCDLNPKVLTDLPRLYPTIHTTEKTSDIFEDPKTNAVVIATPPSTHFSLAKQALDKGKHVLVEKPLAQTSKEASTLVALAKRANKALMVDHTYIYTPAISLLRRIIRSGALGQIIVVDSVRTNLGLFQKDSNVMADLAVHDFSIMDYVFGQTPISITATGLSDASLGQETIAYVSARYGKSLLLHTHVSWLSPIKIRRMMFVGTKKMLLYDDIEPSEKIKIYDKSVSVNRDPKDVYALRVGYRSGDVSIPHIGVEEGLWGMVREFARAIRTSKPATTDGTQGYRVVRCIEAATKSLRNGGKSITL